MATPARPEGGTRWVRCGDTLVRRGLDRLVLLPSSLDHPVALAGPSVGELWDLLATPQPLEVVVDELAQRYCTGAAEIEAGLAPILEQLVTWGAVRAT